MPLDAPVRIARTAPARYLPDGKILSADPSERVSASELRPESGGRYDFLSSGGEMAALMRSHDWRSTPLGDPRTWPQSLRTAIDILLNSRYPMFLCWGPELAFLYNDGYRPIFGDKHPRALGSPFSEIWAEIWDDLEPLVDRAMGGEATWSEDLLLFMERRGFPEEVYFTFSYSPVRNDTGEIAGMFCACTETTGKVLGERRLKTLRDIGTATGDARSVLDVCTLAIDVMAANQSDIPFALLYLVEDDGRSARLVTQTGCAPGTAFAPHRIDVETGKPHGWPHLQHLGRERAVLHDLAPELGLPGTPWPEPCRTAAILPLSRSGHDTLRGYLILGASQRLPFDEHYERFFDLLASGVASALANVEAYEAERRRAEALAEIDRAKTAFFSNVSHEFRTPLTLMLGPLQHVLATPGAVSPSIREQVQLAHRNAMRLLKLVNSLLDFSRIEAGRIQASYEPTDLATLTADVVSNFRSACERAGLELAVQADPLPTPVYVDRDMWEKIVLNLLSNAFKFTFEGRIAVELHEEGGHAVLTVRDTGVGIPEAELPHVFERFHRVAGARGRTHEGSGIGLALVRELVNLHGGTISATSVVDHGTVFTVRLPLGHAHLPPERIGAERTLALTGVEAAAYTEEALKWLPGEEHAEDFAPAGLAPLPLPSPAPASMSAGEILLADDNADMREYLARLLSAHWRVRTAADGAEALELAMQKVPDLVLSDAMMPQLDGFELLRALRADERTRDVPFIMLSARAGEESRIEGIEAGADDYLIKPFSARELVARVSAHLALAQSAQERNALLEREQAARRDAEAANRAKDEFIAMLSHELRNPLAPILTAVELLRLRAGDQLENECALIERQARQLTALVEDLLDVSRIARGVIELRKTRVEMASIVRSAIDMVSPMLEQRAHRLAVDVPDTGLPVFGDEMRLTQVVANLLSNAAKYTPDGGVISVRAVHVDGTAPGHDEAARSGEEAIEVTVADNGAGIPQELLPRIFDMFVQAGQPLDRSLGGLGLGLTIARSIVDQHGGQISASSDGPGRGSVFTIRLPAAGGAQHIDGERRGAARSPVPIDGAAQRVLIVDDNLDAAHSLAMYLDAHGFETQVAHDGPSALRLAQHFVPDVSLLDIGLPGMDGFELAARLRERCGARGLRLIAVTGYAQAAERERAQRQGFTAHLAKPIDLNALVNLLQSDG